MVGSLTMSSRSGGILLLVHGTSFLCEVSVAYLLQIFAQMSLPHLGLREPPYLELLTSLHTTAVSSLP